IFGEPGPYFATLAADGDHMGEALSTIDDIGRHRQLSLDLAGFATAARDKVKNHRGCLVYSGGDDVLAFVPVDRVLDCARALHTRFGEVDSVGRRLTLSVGIAIGHFMDPLEDHLLHAREAERAAKSADLDPYTNEPVPKSERNGLAVHFYPHSG